MTSSHSRDGEKLEDCEGDTECSTGDPEDIERGGERGVDSPEAGEVDPKLAKALEKMKKLDKRLADLVVVSHGFPVYLFPNSKGEHSHCSPQYI